MTVISKTMHRQFRNRFVAAAILAYSCASWSLGQDGVVARINQEIRTQWQENSLRPSSKATDGEWVRRIYLDVLGRIPSVGELEAYRRERRSGARLRLIDRLLSDDRYTAEFAANWSIVWTNLLIGRNGGNERNSLINRDGMEKYLRDSFARSRPYDVMVRDLITAEGSNQPGLEEFNGAVNYLAMKLSDKATQATADTARIFLGKQVQCTQCHDHPFNEWKQNQFWELNSFFRQAVPLRRFDQSTGMVSHVMLTDQDFAGEGTTPDEAEVYFEQRDSTLQAAYPVFINGNGLKDRSGRIADSHRRQALADFILQSDEMPRAIVNRLWAHFFKYGFTLPVDDMGPHNPPTHPDLLDFLAEQFAQNSYDLRLLMRWILSSDAYALSSRVTKQNQSDDPSKGERPLFSRYYVKQMRAEQLFDSLIMATDADRLEQRNQLEKTRRDWLKQFVVAFGNDEGTEGTTFDGTITQSLVLFNGKLTRQALSDKPGSLLYRLNQSNSPLQKKVDHLFYRALARSATKTEQRAATQLVQWRGGDTLAGLQDLWWAVLNSNEFILNH